MAAVQDPWGRLVWLWDRPPVKRVRLTISMAQWSVRLPALLALIATQARPAPSPPFAARAAACICWHPHSSPVSGGSLNAFNATDWSIEFANLHMSSFQISPLQLCYSCRPYGRFYCLQRDSADPLLSSGSLAMQIGLVASQFSLPMLAPLLFGTGILLRSIRTNASLIFPRIGVVVVLLWMLWFFNSVVQNTVVYLRRQASPALSCCCKSCAEAS